MLFHEPAQLPELVERILAIVSKANRTKPELRKVSVPPDMNMRRFVDLVTLEEKHIRPNPQPNRYKNTLNTP